MEYKAFVFTDEEINRLKKSDTYMEKLIEVIGKLERNYTPDLFASLISCIVSQQLSNKAAEAIWNKFSAALPELTPETIISGSQEKFREVGLSNSKIRYIKNIAEAVITGNLVLEELNEKQDVEIAEELLTIKGIGPWTVEMFLIFSLGRRDVLSYGDLGIRKGISWLYGIEGELTRSLFNAIAKKYSPDGTLASLYLWEIGDRNLYRYKSVYDSDLLG